MRKTARRKLLTTFLSSLFILVPFSAMAIDYTVSTVGGGGSGTCTTTPKSALQVAPNSPWGMAADSNGNIYYTDRSAFTICKITTDGNVVRVAGTGVQALGGDNVQATASALYDPIAVAVDSTGVLYIADYSTARSIRRVGLDGVITTVLNVAHGTTSSGNGGLATAASSSGPTGLAISSSNEVYFAEYNSGVVKKIDSNGYLQLVAGTGTSGTTGDGGPALSATLNQPSTLAFDAAGNLYVSSYVYHIRKIDTSGVITKYGGTYGTSSHTGDGGLATAATFKNLWGIATDGVGNLYIPERGGSTIRKINASTGIVTTIIGLDNTTGYVDTSTSVARLGSVYSIAFNAAGDLYFGDLTNSRIRKIAAIGDMTLPAPPSISYNAMSSYRLSSVITSTGGNSGKITFYADGKRIAGCVSVTYNGNYSCSWKPSKRGTTKISAVVVNPGGVSLSSNEISISVAGRTTRR